MKCRLALLLLLCLALLTSQTVCLAEPALAAAGAHILALDAEGGLWAWGSNRRGESVPSTHEPCVTEPVKLLDGISSAACGRQFSMALTAEGTLLMWGDNSAAQIPGLEAERADDFFRAAESVAAIAACESRAALIAQDGRAYVWGDGLEMTCVHENAAQIALGLDFTLVLTPEGEVFSLESEPVRLLTDCVSVAACGESAFAVRSDGTLLAWGANGSEGRLGLEADVWVSEPTALPIDNVVATAPGVSASAALDDAGRLYIWGCLYSYVVHYDEEGTPAGSLVDAELIRYGSAPVCLMENARAAALGDAFAAVMLTDGSILIWGSNDQGQIGDGTRTETAFTPAEDEEEEGEVTLVSFEQRIFPVCLRLGF